MSDLVADLEREEKRRFVGQLQPSDREQLAQAIFDDVPMAVRPIAISHTSPPARLAILVTALWSIEFRVEPAH